MVLLFKKCLETCIRNKEKYEKMITALSSPPKPPNPKKNLPVEIEMVPMGKPKSPVEAKVTKSVKIRPEVEVMTKFEIRLGIIQSISVTAKKINDDQENAKQRIAELREKVDLISSRADKSLTVLREYDVLDCDKLSEKLNKLREQALLDLREAEVRVKECGKGKAKRMAEKKATKGEADTKKDAPTTIAEGSDDSDSEEKDKKGGGKKPPKKPPSDDDDDEDDDTLLCENCGEDLDGNYSKRRSVARSNDGCINCCVQRPGCQHWEFRVNIGNPCTRCTEIAERARKEEEDRLVAEESERVRLEKEAEEKRVAEEELRRKVEADRLAELERKRLADEQLKREQDERARIEIERKAAVELARIERERVPAATPAWFSRHCEINADAIYTMFRNYLEKRQPWPEFYREHHLSGQKTLLGVEGQKFSECDIGELSRFIANDSKSTVYYTKDNHLGTPAYLVLKSKGEVMKDSSFLYKPNEKSIWSKQKA